MRNTLLAILSFAVTASAHEMRPAYLELRETPPDEFSVLWKTPMLGNARLALYVVSGLLTLVGIFAMRKDLISRHMHFFTDVNLNVQVVQMNPLAVYNAMYNDQKFNGTTLGGRTLTVEIAKPSAPRSGGGRRPGGGGSGRSW
jgi:uncharacterized membrane protein YgcG